MSRPDSRKIIVATLALLALGVVFLLPNFVPELQVAAPAAPDVAPDTPRDVSPSRAAEKKRFREKAQQTLAEIFALRDKLEEIQVTRWNGETYGQAKQQIASGDEQYSLGDYEKSLASYGQALEALKTLDAESETLLADSLAGARRAIEDGAVEKARRHMVTLNYLAPDDPTVMELSSRVEQLPAVAQLIADGQQHRAQGDLAAAEQALARAVELDPQHRRTADLLAQVRATQQQQAFNRRMGSGYSALEQGNYAAAREHFEAARGIDPANSAVVQALSQLENRDTRNQVDHRLAQARNYEAEENWQQAVAVYQQLVALDDSLTEPRVRLIPARIRADLDKRLEALIAEPLALSRPGVAAEAAQALGDARGIVNPGEKLRGQIDRLSALLERSTLPVDVRFESDNLTEVTLYRVGRLGTFESRVLELKPGKYVAAGARKGYRDVRVEFTVSGDLPDSPIVVRCTEAI